MATKARGYDINVWDLATAKRTTIKNAADTSLSKIGFSDDGKAVWSVEEGNEKTVKWWDRATGQEIAKFDGKKAPSTEPDITRVSKALEEEPLSKEGNVAAAAPDAMILVKGQGSIETRMGYVHSKNEGFVRVFDANKKSMVAKIKLKVSVLAEDVTADGKLIAAACSDGKVRVWDVGK